MLYYEALLCRPHCGDDAISATLSSHSHMHRSATPALRHLLFLKLWRHLHGRRRLLLLRLLQLLPLHQALRCLELLQQRRLLLALLGGLQLLQKRLLLLRVQLG